MIYRKCCLVVGILQVQVELTYVAGTKHALVYDGLATHGANIRIDGVQGAEMPLNLTARIIQYELKFIAVCCLGSQLGT